MKKIKLLLPILFIVSLLVYFSLFTTIESIDCRNDQGDCPSTVISSIESVESTSVYRTRNFLADSLSDNQLVKSFDMHFEFPDKMIVTVRTRQPQFSLRTGEESSWYSIVDEEGVVLSVKDKSSLDSIYTEKLYNPGERVDQNVLKSYKIYNYIKPYFNIDKAEARDEGLFLETVKGFQAIIPYDKDIELSIGAALVVFNRLNTSAEKSIMDNRDYQELISLCSNGCLVDFRFQNPVIKDKI